MVCVICAKDEMLKNNVNTSIVMILFISIKLNIFIIKPHFEEFR